MTIYSGGFRVITDIVGTPTQKWGQLVLQQTDGWESMYLLGTDYQSAKLRNLYGLSPVETRDLIGDFELTRVGAPTLSTRSSLAGPSVGVADSGYTSTATPANYVFGDDGNVVENHAINSLRCVSTPTGFSVGDTITINGHAITIVASGASGYQVNNGNAKTVMQAVRDLVNANPAYFACKAWVDPSDTSSDSTLRLWTVAKGAAANTVTMAISLSVTTKTLRGANFDGGTDAALTIAYIGKSTAAGKNAGAGFVDAAHAFDCFLGMWQSGASAFTQGVSAFASNTIGNRRSAIVAAESGQESTAWILGIMTARHNQITAWRMRSGLANPMQAEDTTAFDLAATGSTFAVGVPSTSLLSTFPNKGNHVFAAVRNCWSSPSDIALIRSDLNNNLLNTLGMTV